MRFVHGCKSLVKAILPRAVWEWFFGALFTIVLRRYRSDGMVFEVPSKLISIRLRAFFFFDNFERPERIRVASYIKSQDRVLELGGAIGVVSCATNRILSDKRAHVVVEAHPEVIPFLYRNRQRNQAGFTIIHSAVSPNPVEDFQPGEQLHHSRVRSSQHSVIVPGVTLGELNERYGPFTVLVMDIEGTEKFVIESSPQTLANLRLIILELHPAIIGQNACEELRQQLTLLGFERLEQEPSNVESWQRKELPAQAT